MSAHAPTLDRVIAHVTPGRRGRLLLTDKQRDAFKSNAGRRFLRHLRALHRARADAAPHAPAPLPVTPGALQQVARKNGEQPVGIKRTYALLHQAVAVGVLTPRGTYRARNRKTGDRKVPLYTLATATSTVRSPASHSTGGKNAGATQIQPVRWWQHPLFGDADGLPPPGLTRRQRRRMRSADEYGRVIAG